MIPQRRRLRQERVARRHDSAGRSLQRDTPSRASVGTSRDARRADGRVVETLLAGTTLAVLGGLFVFWLVLGDELSREFVEDAASEQSLWDEREVELGAWLAVSSTSDTRFLLADGFNGAEQNGAWMLEQRASIKFLIADEVNAESATLRFSLPPEAAEVDISLTVRSSLDEVSVDLRVGEGEIRVLLGDGPQHVVEFECSTMFSPSDQASSADSRRLCVYVTALRVDAPASLEESP